MRSYTQSQGTTFTFYVTSQLGIHKEGILENGSSRTFSVQIILKIPWEISCFP